MTDNTETSKSVFFKYAFPCGDELYSLGLINKLVHERIQKYVETKKTPDCSFLESTFPSALERIEKLAKSLNRNKWDVFVIRKYFLEEHNKVIDRLEGNYKIIPPVHRELCKVKVGIVNKIYYNKERLLIYDINFGDKIQAVVGKYLPKVKVGDKISIHWNFAIEKID